MQKNKAIAPIRQTVGLLAYLFPPLVSSSFNAEVPFTLEETAERLKKLSRVQVSKPAPTRFTPVYWRFHQFINYRETVVERPISVIFTPLDPDTLGCHIIFSDNRFRIVVRGYLKRWDRFSTVVKVRANFNPDYLGLLVKGMAYAFVVFIFLALRGIFAATLERFPLIVPVAVLFFTLVIAALWLTEVVIPAHARRARLMTRIEDILLLPML